MTDIDTTDLEIQIIDAIAPWGSHQHPEQKFKSDTLDTARRIATVIRKERALNDFMLMESAGEHTEFRLVVNSDGSYYCHVLGRDSKTFDGVLFRETKKKWIYYSQKWENP